MSVPTPASAFNPAFVTVNVTNECSRPSCHAKSFTSLTSKEPGWLRFFLLRSATLRSDASTNPQTSTFYKSNHLLAAQFFAHSNGGILQRFRSSLSTQKCLLGCIFLPSISTQAFRECIGLFNCHFLQAGSSCVIKGKLSFEESVQACEVSCYILGR